MLKIILQQNVAGQGKKGDMVEVSDGYARNYLFPRKLAIEATADAVNSYKISEKAKADHLAAEKRKAETAAEKLKTCHVMVYSKSGPGGRLFGAVTSQEIADALKAQFGVVIDKKSLVLPEPIKHHGLYTLKAKFGHEVSATLTVEVAEAKE